MKPLRTGCLVYTKYKDHVVYQRSNPDVVMPQVRECVGWLNYQCPEYIVLSWDRDSRPMTLKGGDAKASGLVVLRSDILDLRRLLD